MSKCPKCGAPMESHICDYCGYIQQVNFPVSHPSAEKPSASEVTQFVINTQFVSPYTTISPKKRWIAFLICYALGLFGGHYFYVGKTGMGMLYLFTAGLFGIGWIADMIRIAAGKFVDANNLPLKK